MFIKLHYQKCNDAGEPQPGAVFFVNPKHIATIEPASNGGYAILKTDLSACGGDIGRVVCFESVPEVMEKIAATERPAQNWQKTVMGRIDESGKQVVTGVMQ